MKSPPKTAVTKPAAAGNTKPKVSIVHVAHKASDKKIPAKGPATNNKK